MKCYACHTDNPSDAMYCAKCGASQGFSEELIQRAIKGDQAAIEELYNRTYNNAYLTIKAMLKDEDTVLDLTQDTYIQAFRNLEQLKDAAKFRAWIKRIAHNLAVDYLRKAKPVMFSRMTADSDEMLDIPDERTENLPDAVIDRNETTRLMKEILDSLPEDQRAVIAMFYFEQMSIREISEELGSNENSIKSRLSYGRKKVEIQVKELEKKGTKLYNLAPIPFLLWLFRGMEAQAAQVPNAAILAAVKTECAQAVVAVAQGAAGQTTANIGASAASTAGKTVLTKVIAAVAAVAIIGGSAVGIHALLEDETPPITEEQQSTMPIEEVPSADLGSELVGYYTSADTNIAIEISENPDGSLHVFMENIAPYGANAWNFLGDAFLQDDRMVFPIPTEAQDSIVFLCDYDGSIRVEATEHYQARANTYISGSYYLANSSISITDFLHSYVCYNEIDDIDLTLSVQGDSLSSTLGEDVVIGHVTREYYQYKLVGNVLYGYFVNGGDFVHSFTLNEDGSILYRSTEEYDAFSESVFLPVEQVVAPDTAVNLAQYDDYAYRLGDGTIKYQLETADGALVLRCWFQHGDPEYYEEDYIMHLESANISGSTYTITQVSDAYADISFKFLTLQFVFGDGTVEMVVERDMNTYAGGDSGNLNTGTYIFSK